MSEVGHNSGGDALRLLIERIERLEEDKSNIGDDIKDVYVEAKSRGFDGKTMRQIVRLRKMKPEDRKYQQELLQTYASAIGLDLI